MTAYEFIYTSFYIDVFTLRCMCTLMYVITTRTAHNINFCIRKIPTVPIVT